MRRRRPSCLACSRATRSAPQAAEQTSATACISQRASQTRRPTSWTFSRGNRGTCASGRSILRPASATMAVSTIFIFHPVAIAPNELSRGGPALSFCWRTNLMHLLTATLSISRVVNLGSPRSSLARYGNTASRSISQNGTVQDQRVVTIRMPAWCGFGMLPIVQADGVAIATKLD